MVTFVEVNDGVLIVRAPLSGVVWPLERIPDPVFAQKMVGDGAVAEDEAAFRARGQTVMVVTRRLVPAITRLITRQKRMVLRERPNKTLQSPSRAGRKSKPCRNSRAACG